MPIGSLLRRKSSIRTSENNLEVRGHNLVRESNTNNTKRGGVCIYYHHFLSLKVIDILFLNEYIDFEVRIGEKVFTFICLYRSPI